MQKLKKYKLNIELVPDSCWYSNLRSILSKEDWDLVRKESYARANGRCMICGKATPKLEAHENWSYDEKSHVQKLADVIAICHDCHSVIHIGRTQLVGDYDKAIKHFQTVNECSYAEYIEHLGKANTDHKRRNLIPEWSLDLTYLQKFIKKQ